jgi:SPP1 family predicted phage head-tail adaptor
MAVTVVDAGSLIHPVTIEAPTVGAQDSFGAPAITWSTFATARASIEPASGREFDFAKSFVSTSTYKITIRYQNGIRPDMRVKFGSRIFSIEYILHVEERNRMLILFSIEQPTT